MEALAKLRDDVRLRIVDIKSWDSDVARQHDIRRLPSLWMYENGKLLSKVSKEVIEKIQSLR